MKMLRAAFFLGVFLGQLGRSVAAQTDDGSAMIRSVPREGEPQVIVDCRISGNCSSGRQLGRSFQGTYAYAYAPAMIFDSAGTTHYFFCSSGDGIGLDAIRYISVSAHADPKSKRAPIVVVRARPTKTADGRTVDMAACDPSIVRFKGPEDDKPYYYLHYTSVVMRLGYKSCGEPSRDGARPCKDVIQVARSERIDGPYLVLKENGIWGAPGVAAKVILESFGSNWGIGLAQQSVMVIDGKLVMFYCDDTDAPQRPTRPWYMIQSHDPIVWDKSKAIEVQLPTRVEPDDKYMNSGDVKYDSVRHQFILVRIALQELAPLRTFLQVSSSTDGLHWAPWLTAVPPSRFPKYAHNPGTLSDDQGRIVRRDGKFSFGFAANPDLSPDNTWCPPKPDSGCIVWSLYQMDVPGSVVP
jgi:hypothetical protein